MKQAWFRFYEELNDMLPGNRKKVTFPYMFTGNQTVKDAIEAIGIPHVEVDMILANGQSVDFSYRIRNDDRISVYPVFESLDIASVTHLRSKPLRETRFVLDAHLGKLARYLRLLGYDSIFSDFKDDTEIVDISLSEKRIILTRDKQLLKNRKVTHGYWVRSDRPELQLKEVFRRFDLNRSVVPFSRCMECNSLLDDVDKADIADRLEPRTRKFYNNFKICSRCKHIYWEGSHYEKMKRFVEGLEDKTGSTP